MAGIDLKEFRSALTNFTAFVGGLLNTILEESESPLRAEERFDLKPLTNWQGNPSDFLVLIHPKDLETLMRLKSALKFKKNKSFPYITIFKPLIRYLVTFDWINENDIGLNYMEKVLNDAAEYNIRSIQTQMQEPFKIWVAIVPDKNVSSLVHQVLSIIQKCNLKYNGTIVALLLNYRLLQLTSETYQVVRQDFSHLNRAMNLDTATQIKAGVILDQRNCNGKDRLIQALNLQAKDHIIFKAFYDYVNPVTAISKSFECARIGRKVKAVISEEVIFEIKANMSDGTATFPIQSIAFFSFLQNFKSCRKFRQNLRTSSSFLIVKLSTVNKKRNKHNMSYELVKELPTLESWLRNPVEFSRHLFSVTVHHSHIEQHFAQILPQLGKCFNKVVIEDQIASLTDFNRLTHTVKTMANITIPEMVITKNLFATAGVKLSDMYGETIRINKQYNGLISEIWLSWSPCFGTQSNCLSTHNNELRNGELVNIDGLQKMIDINWLTESGLLKTFLLKTLLPDKETQFSPKIGIIVEPKVFIELFIIFIIPKWEVDLWSSVVYIVDFFVLKIVVQKQDIVDQGAVKVSLSAIQDLHNFEQVMKIHFGVKLRNTKMPLYIKLMGCESNSEEDIYGQAYIVRFWELMNSWVVKENITVIIGTGFEFQSSKRLNQSAQCSTNTQNESSNVCDCGWWQVTRNKDGSTYHKHKELSFTDRKLIAWQKYQKEKTPHSESTDEKSDKIFLITILIPVFLIACFASLVTPYYILRCRSKYVFTRQEIRYFKGGRKYEEKRLVENIDLDRRSRAESQPYNISRYELSPSSFTIDAEKCLGTGEFGKVCWGSIKRQNFEDISIAVKMMKTTDANSHGEMLALKALMSEIKILSYVGEHKNIVKLEGAYTAKLRSGKLYVFLELCQLGGLDKFLRLQQPPQWDTTTDTGEMYNVDRKKHRLPENLSRELYKWAGEIATGMEYLASKHLFHGDLATRNVLLTSDKTAKISDFGLSRRLYDYSEYLKTERGPLPWKWMAPESLRRMVFNEKTDVWAFGVTLWEMYSLGDEPYAGQSWTVNFPIMLEQGLRLPEPKYNKGKIFSLLRRCWDAIPDQRPSFIELIFNLTDVDE